jgi:hypothetical protein
MLDGLGNSSGQQPDYLFYRVKNRATGLHSGEPVLYCALRGQPSNVAQVRVLLSRACFSERTRDITPTMQLVVLRSHVLFRRRPDQFAPTERTEVYSNSTFSHWNVPIFLVKEKETSSPLVGQPHKPETALGMDELL